LYVFLFVQCGFFDDPASKYLTSKSPRFPVSVELTHLTCIEIVEVSLNKTVA